MDGQLLNGSPRQQSHEMENPRTSLCCAMSFLKTSKWKSLDRAPPSRSILQTSLTQLPAKALSSFAKPQFNFIFLIFLLDNWLKMLILTFTKHLGVRDNFVKLESKHVISISHFIQLKDSLKLDKNRIFVEIEFVILKTRNYWTYSTSTKTSPSHSTKGTWSSPSKWGRCCTCSWGRIWRRRPASRQTGFFAALTHDV